MARQTPAAAFHPYIDAHTRIPEFTLRGLIVGTLLGMVFGASSLYLVLKVGLTVSASIPVAVISITLFRMASKLRFKDATILENNIVQTAGSAGESIAFGVGVTMPAILILGFDLELTRVMIVAVLGGLLGILMMIPLRRALIVAQHGVLKYPEGTACAEVLKAGASEESRAAASDAAKAEEQKALAAGLARGTSARTIFTGFGIGLLYKTGMAAFKLWKDVPEKVFGRPYPAGSMSAEISPELLGVGYIIGPRIASVMCAGGVMAYLLLIPLIKFFGENLPDPLPPGSVPIRDMGPSAIRSAYVLYIGAGAVTAGGIVSLARSLPTIWSGLKEGLRDVSLAKREPAAVPRTERDLSMKVVGIGVVLLLAAISITPQLHMNPLGAILILIFGFLFVTVSSRLTGEIGSSSNPISGMTVATLLLTCLIFLVMGWTGGPYYVTALSVGAIVCIAASNGGTTSQDLKTGYLVGATPRLQQISILIGAFASSLILGPILLRLNDAATVYVPAAEVAPAGLTAPVGRFAGEELLRGPQATADSKSYAVWQKTGRRGRAGGEVSGRSWERHRGLPGGSRHQRRASHPPRRHHRHQVRRPQGHSHELHHQGNPGSRAALGTGAVRRHDRGGSGDVGNPLPSLRGGSLSAAFVLESHSHRRIRPLAGGPAPSQGSCPCRAERGTAGRGERQERGSAHGLGLHRRRRHRRHPHRVHGRCPGRFRPIPDRLVRRPQPLLRGTPGGSPCAGAVRRPGGDSLSHRA